MQKTATKNQSAKLRFVLENLSRIIELEKDLAENVMNEDAIKSNKRDLLIKLTKGGWMQARDIFVCQEIFKEEKTFLQALIFLKRYTVQTVENTTAKQATMNTIVIKMDPSPG